MEDQQDPRLKYTDEEIQSGTAKIFEMLEQADALLDQARKLADEFRVGFYFSVAGAYYCPKGDDDKEFDPDEEGHWVSSSDNC